MKTYFIGVLYSALLMSLLGSFIGHDVIWLYTDDCVGQRIALVFFSLFFGIGYMLYHEDKGKKSDRSNNEL